MQPTFLTIPLSSTQSSAGFIIPAARMIAVQVPSLSPAVELRMQCSAASGGNGSYWSDVYKPDGSGIPFAICSGNAPAWNYLIAPTAFIRFTVSSALSVATSIGIFQLNR
jgi:hypothetical protein